MSEWINVDDRLPTAHEYVVLKHKYGAPPIIGWAVYWEPSGEFAGFEVQQESYADDYGKQFTHWMPLPEPPTTR